MAKLIKNSDKKAASPKLSRKSSTISKKLSKKSSDKALKKKTSATSAKTKTVAKKAKVPPKRAGKSEAGSEKTLDLCLILDCTASMGSWIVRSKDTLKMIIDQVKAENPALRVRVAFVGYRDFGDGKDQYSTIDFSENVDTVKAFI